MKFKRVGVAVLLVFVFATVAFAMYKTSIQVTYEGTVGNMVCDVEIENDPDYVVNGIPYFLVKVRNYNEEEGLTQTDIDYSLTIKNKTGSNGLFIWKNGDDYITTYAKQVVTNTYSFDKTQDEHVFQVFVKTAGESLEDVDVEVKLDAVQRNMD